MESQQHIGERCVTEESHRSFRLSRRPDAVLSSGSTSFYKRWFPAIWLGLPAVALLGQLFRIARVGHVTPKDLGLLGVCILFLAVGIPIFRRLAFCLVDEVVDEGDFLLVRSEGHQERVPLGSIAGVLDGPTMRPFQITLNLDQPCRFGQKITFIPRYRLVWNGLHPLVDELRSRVEAVRGNRPEINSKKAEPGAAADGGGG